ncbi:MAG: type III pantothenate kinase [Clostridiaceae bacterium]|nr:type III pantothenate kinase [Clostridiaceae bacterium]
MLFTCNIENTTVSFGVFDGDMMIFNAQIATSCEKSSDEYAILINNVFSMNHLALSSVDGAIISSVVRPLNETIGQAIEQLLRVKPLFVGPGVKTGLNIKTDFPSQVGADIVANAVAALSLVKSPLVLLDFNTATTLTGINENGELCGVLIYPGVRSSLKDLSDHAAELPRIALDSPKHLLGKNTIDSMVSGIIYGNAAMIDGILDRLAEEWNTMELTVIATGGLADKIIAYCRCKHKIQYEPNLTLLGLKKIYSLNDRHKHDVKAEPLL